MITLLDGLPLPRIEFEVALGLDAQEMAGGGLRLDRLFEHLPMSGTATWRVSRSMRAALVARLDEIGEARFWTRLRMPHDPRPWRSVEVYQAGPAEVAPVTRQHDDVAVPLVVEWAPIVIDWGGLLSPDGSPLLTPSGAELHHEELG